MHHPDTETVYSLIDQMRLKVEIIIFHATYL